MAAAAGRAQPRPRAPGSRAQSGRAPRAARADVVTATGWAHRTATSSGRCAPQERCRRRPPPPPCARPRGSGGASLRH
eukprot:scaffold33233_cov59-Phaeocystis_antarctica.AAC.3